MARDSAGRRGSGRRRVGRARATASAAGRCRDAATPARDGRRSSAPCGTRGTPPRRFRRAPATRAPRRRAHRARPAPPATGLAPPRSSRTARGPASSPPPRPSWAPGRYQGTPQAVTLPTRKPEEPKLKRLTPKDQRLIRTALQELQADPWTARLAPLQHQPTGYRLEVGNWRLPTDVYADELLIVVSDLLRRPATTYRKRR